MSTTTVANPGYRERVGYQAALLGGFAFVATALLVIGDLATRDAIAQREAEDLLASLSQVIPAGLHDNALLADAITLDTTDGALTVYRALRGLEVTGVAFETVGPGYAGPIRVLLGIGADGRVLGARVLSHTETPGLGDKIEVARDDWILRFDGKSLGEPPPERWAVQKDGGDFDQFSGATITPRAVVRAVKRGLERFAAHRDTLTASAVQQVSSDP
ncbi:electron transport complex subunit RsxG [uncultured Thiohalocapsa sp.]|uniref:electron transport complex subunit RsxG n=1 Tax=uncultured Thiohalocapsa sp. TaxID=768990 RepID=UPI0025CD06B0|nr:electron transport complex subunit RsxG [uncultured Thiohalocapsa sp.]